MIPYDYDTFYQYKGTCYSVVTNIETGCPEYIPIKDMKQDIEAIRASASLPLLSKNVVWKDHLYLDGGISDANPLRASVEAGNTGFCGRADRSRNSIFNSAEEKK